MAHTSWVILKRKATLQEWGAMPLRLRKWKIVVDDTPHCVLYGPEIVSETGREYCMTYRAPRKALCGASRGKYGWRLVGTRGKAPAPPNACETCMQMQIVVGLKGQL